MIETRSDLRNVLKYEKQLYFPGKDSCLRGWLLCSKCYRIWKYLRNMRIAEYHKNNSGIYHKLLFIRRHRIKNILGIKLGFEISENCAGGGLMIYHIAPIIINEDARIGENCRITGDCCIGNTGAGTPSPRLGSNVTLGWGSCVIGDIEVADDVIIGAGCVLTRSVTDLGAHVAGVPGRKLIPQGGVQV